MFHPLLIVLLIQGVFSQITYLNYTYLTHGSDSEWGNLSSKYTAVCTIGKKQSPLNLTTQNILPFPNIHYFFTKYAPAQATAYYYNVSLTIMANNITLGFGTILTVLPNGNKYPWQAKSVIFRAPAEHIVNNQRYPLEVQIYHTSPGKMNNYLAVSLFFTNSTSENELLGTVISNNQTGNNTFDLDLSQWISFEDSDDMEYWGYAGSMTMPPCMQLTTWFLMKQIYNATDAQLEYFTNLYHNNPNFQGDGNYRNVEANQLLVYDYSRN